MKKPLLLWLGGLVAVVVIALLGRSSERIPIPHPSPSPSAPIPVIVFHQPPPGTTMFGVGQVPVQGQWQTAGVRTIHIAVVAQGFEIGSRDVQSDAEGWFYGIVPVLPPVAGGTATVSVSSGGLRAQGSVDARLEPANPILLWAPEAQSTIDGDALYVVGYARPPVERVRLELRWPNDVSLSEAIEQPEPRPGSNPVTAPWAEFTAFLAIPAVPEQGCVFLHAYALGDANDILFETSVALNLAAASPATRCFS